MFVSLCCCILIPPIRALIDLSHLVLIAYRVWMRQNPIRDSRRAFSLSKEAAIIVESAAIYFVTLICVISTDTTASNAFNVFLDMVSLTLSRLGGLALVVTV